MVTIFYFAQRPLSFPCKRKLHLPFLLSFKPKSMLIFFYSHANEAYVNNLHSCAKHTCFYYFYSLQTKTASMFSTPIQIKFAFITIIKTKPMSNFLLPRITNSMSNSFTLGRPNLNLYFHSGANQNCVYILNIIHTVYISNIVNFEETIFIPTINSYVISQTKRSAKTNHL